ncbi:MAG: ATP-binding protein, partial [Eubacterium sp.]|nr:ATP-binding protein [Eubacterium sp.]
MLDRHQKLERESVLAEHNKKYYEAMEQQQFEIRRLKHDLANHLQVLTALPEEEKNNYIKEMLDNPIFTKVLAYSG